MTPRFLPLRFKLFAFVFLVVLGVRAHGFEQYKEFKRDTWDFELGTDYFTSDANYDSGGTRQTLASGSSYSLTNFSLGTRYVPSRQWSIFALGNIGMSVSKNSIATRTNSSLNWALFGADFLMYSGAVDIVPEFAAVIPFEKVDRTADSSLNGEGVLEGRTRITVQTDLGSARGFGYVGMTFRDEERSFLMPWGVGVNFKARHFLLGAELFGSQSISDDKDKKNETPRNAYLNTVNAGSYAFYSINPSKIDTNFSVLWSLSPAWSLKGEAGLTLAGTNSAAGYHAGAFLRYTFDMTDGYVQEPAYEPISSPVPRGKSNLYYDSEPDHEVQTFKEDTNDGVDQKIFNLRPKVKNQKKSDQLQKQLDATEFDIELKSKKRKKKR